MTESSFHQAKSNALGNGKENETSLRRHAPYLIGGEIRKLNQIRTKGNEQKLLFVK
jgi:hypothetical protein